MGTSLLAEARGCPPVAHVRFLARARAQDIISELWETVEPVDDKDDIVHAIMRSPHGRQDFSFLRSWREGTGGSEWVISSRSVEHPGIPPTDGVTRGEVLSSGFIMRDVTDTDGAPRTSLTYIVQLGTRAVALLLGDVAGFAGPMVKSLTNLQGMFDKGSPA
jgi:hypothetical protein